MSIRNSAVPSSRRPLASWMTRQGILLSLTGLVLSSTGCSSLDVSAPTTIQGSSLDNPSGARDLWTSARVNFFIAASNSVVFDGLASDEFFVDASSTSIELNPAIDRRESALTVTRLATGNWHGYDQWQTVRSAADIAMPRVRAYSVPGAREAQLGELFALRGYAALRLAESFCPGFPLREVKNYVPVYGPPLTTAEAFTTAVAEFDSALVYAKDSARVLNFARIGKARALLALGHFTAAAAVSALVPSGYEMSDRPHNNAIVDFFNTWQAELFGISDREGGVGLDFVSAADPRVGLRAIRNAQYGDTSTVMYGSTKYESNFPAIVVANDIEARLIQAEAMLNAHDGTWLTILNDLRANKSTPALPALSDPGSFAAQVDLLFRERAFWLFATGHRLGDLRRMIQLYGRASDAVFPTGAYRSEGTYGTATRLPFNPTLEVRANSAVTGCTDE